MNISITTSHTVVFTVQAFWDEEGGMGQDQYGKGVSELADAIRMVDLARIADPKREWVIVGTVTTSVD